MPTNLQYLFVNYEPIVDGCDDYPKDWTWEREWRIRCGTGGLPIYLHLWENCYKSTAIGALVVETDRNVGVARGILKELADSGSAWAPKLTRIISLETVERKIAEGDLRYNRIETYPE